MKHIKFMGEFDGNIANLPHRENLEKANKFREPDTLTQLTLLGVIVSFFLIFSFTNILHNVNDENLAAGALLALLFLPVHEILHAIWFKGEARIYFYLSKGMLFVTGTEDLTKLRYIILSLFPNIILGIIPFMVYLFNNSFEILGAFGSASIIAGAIDYINVFNAITQVPKGASVFVSGINTYWYFPKSNIS